MSALQKKQTYFITLFSTGQGIKPDFEKKNNFKIRVKSFSSSITYIVFHFCIILELMNVYK